MVEFELEKLPPRKCWELNKYVLTCIQQNIKRAKRKKNDQMRRQNNAQMKAQSKSGSGPGSQG